MGVGVVVVVVVVFVVVVVGDQEKRMNNKKQLQRCSRLVSLMLFEDSIAAVAVAAAGRHCTPAVLLRPCSNRCIREAEIH